MSVNAQSRLGVDKKEREKRIGQKHKSSHNWQGKGKLPIPSTLSNIGLDRLDQETLEMNFLQNISHDCTSILYF